jgi:type III secretory pathway component EscR
MKKVTSKSLNNIVILCIGMIIGMFVIGLTKPVYKKVKEVNVYVKTADWTNKKLNSREVGYYNHLYNTQ